MHACCTQLKDILLAPNLLQYITSPTDEQGHCLDLVITQTDELPLISLEIPDHSAITFSLPVKSQVTRKRLVWCFNPRGLDLEAFKHNVSKCAFVTTPTDDLETVVTDYNMCLSEILDAHVPLAEKVTVDHSQSPRFTDVCKLLKTKKKRAERNWRKT